MWHFLKYFNISTSISVLPINITRKFNSLPTSVELLNNRALVDLRGNETQEFLQGIITNDMNHLSSNGSALYSLMLNTQGRVLFDVIITKKALSHFLIDCDSSKVNSVINHLRLYRVRRKIDIKCLFDSYKVYALFNNYDINKVENLQEPNLTNAFDTHKYDEIFKEIIFLQDPRVKLLGYRLLIPSSVESNLVFSNFTLTDGNYLTLRYKLGIGEGMQELHPAKCLPLEANCDYLRGISFHKGCYIGQELTARTHHTGVVRKRYMPLQFNGDTSDNMIGGKILNEKQKAVGKVICFHKNVGIGLMRVEEALTANSLTIGNTVINTYKPHWWPIEASKEKVPH